MGSTTKYIVRDHVDWNAASVYKYTNIQILKVSCTHVGLPCTYEYTIT